MTGWIILAVVQAIFVLGNIVLWRMQSRQLDAAGALARDVIESLRIAGQVATGVQETTLALMVQNEQALARLKAMLRERP